jgi:hypothetical protein
MHVLGMASGSRWCVELGVARPLRLRALGAAVRVCAPPDEGGDPLVMPLGVWR